MPSFVFAKLLIPSLNVLSDYFLVCQFGGSSYCLNIDKSRDTAAFNGKVVALNMARNLGNEWEVLRLEYELTCHS